MNHCSPPFYFLLLQLLQYYYNIKIFNILNPVPNQLFNSGQRTALNLKLKKLKFKFREAEGLSLVIH